MTTLIVVLTIAGYTEYSVYFVADQTTCDRWGTTMLEAGEASEYSCIASTAGSA